MMFFSSIYQYEVYPLHQSLHNQLTSHKEYHLKKFHPLNFLRNFFDTQPKQKRLAVSL